ncbi:MAG: hypothetical protein GTO24_12140 [candidate division Zixibacteria bacterium]|nr:hypothetical protein [candidate division Zixibacteria bacterium]
MREMDFPDANFANRWLGVKSIWKEIQGGKRERKGKGPDIVGEEVYLQCEA